MSEPLLKVQLEAFYGRTPVLKNIRFEISPGEALGLIGTSGAGKSTLLLAMLGLLPWKGGTCKGEVLFEGVNLLSLREPEARRLRGRRIALIPQSPATALNGSVSLRTHFEQAWKAHEGVRADLDGRLRELMAQVKLPTSREFLGRKPGEISLGQGQRVLIALALLHRPALILADEPTSALDTVNQAEIVALLRSLAATGTTLLYISHDLLSLLQLCRRVAMLDQGSIAECLPVDRIAASARHPATLAMLEALQVPSALLQQLCGPLRVPDQALASTPTRQGGQSGGGPAESSLRPSWFPAARR